MDVPQLLLFRSSRAMLRLSGVLFLAEIRHSTKQFLQLGVTSKDK